MSRSGYSDDLNEWSMIRWRGAVASAIRGRRGQAFLKELIAALDALPEKKLIGNEFECNGEFCALGAVARARGMDFSVLDVDNRGDVADKFGISEALAAEIMDWNDNSWFGKENVEQHRWQLIRDWAEKHLKEKENV